MPTESRTQGKICRICGQDCSGRPRTKDRKGRYYCRACYEQAKEKQQARPARPPSPRADPVEPPVAGPAADDIDLWADLAQGEGVDVPTDAPATSCRNCGASLAPNAALCVQCGTDPRTGQQLQTATAAPPEAKSKTKRAKSGGGGIDVSGMLSQPWVAFVAPAAVLGILFVIGLASEDAAVLYHGAQGLFAIAVGIIVLVRAFGESVGTGLMTLCIPFYALYYVFAVNGSPHLKAAFTVSILSTVAGLALPSAV